MFLWSQAGEYLKEAVSDKKYYGSPEIQKAIVCLFKKVEVSYEDLVGQDGSDAEPTDIEEQPLSQLLMDEDALDTEGLSDEYSRMCQQIGWHVDA